MRKMMARSDYEKNKAAYRNEEQFNNFSVTKNRPRMSLDFEKLIEHFKRNFLIDSSNYESCIYIVVVYIFILF
jgi:hypothetical protein